MTHRMTRKAFLQTLAAVAASAAYVPTFTACSRARQSRMGLGVSLYSYQGDFLRSMSLEDCIADVADMGGDGIEILSETHVPGYPNPSDSWVEEWHGLMDKYKTRPACFSTWVDSLLRKDRSLTVQESLDFLLRDLNLAKRLGFKVMRPKLGTVTDDGMIAPEALQAMEQAVPHAEELDIRIAPEIHSPTRIKSKTVESFMEIISKTNTKHFGFVWDMSIFTRRPPRAFMKMLLPAGDLHDNIADAVDKAYMENVPSDKAIAEVAAMGGSETDKQYAGWVYSMCTMEDPRDLIPFLPHTYHFHGKFWQMTDDLHEYSIPYEEVLPVLIEAGYDGYMCSEYEGPRDLLLAPDQLRRHHAMMRQVIGAA